MQLAFALAVSATSETSAKKCLLSACCVLSVPLIRQGERAISILGLNYRYDATRYRRRILIVVSQINGILLGADAASLAARPGDDLISALFRWR